MTPRCTNSLGRRGPCNEPLCVEVSPLGAVRYRCRRCAARADGRCWNCGKPRTNDLQRGIFCTSCAHASLRLAQKRSELTPERKRKRRAYDRRLWRNPEVRERKQATTRAWLAANTERVREYKRRDWKRHREKARLKREARRL